MTALTKPCAGCGVEVRRDRAEGRYAGLLNNLDFWCDACTDQAEAVEASEAAERARLERRRDAEARCGIPRDLRAIDLERLDQSGNVQAFRAAEQWATGNLDGLVLHGPVGVGKTTLAAAAAWGRLDFGGVRWASVPALIARAFGDDEAQAQVAATLTQPGPLVLDDIDKVKPGEWVAAQLFTAVDTRVAHGSPLLVTSNLRVSELAARLDERFGSAVASRLAGWCEIHEVAGLDRRLEAA